MVCGLLLINTRSQGFSAYELYKWHVPITVDFLSITVFLTLTPTLSAFGEDIIFFKVAEIIV